MRNALNSSAIGRFARDRASNIGIIFGLMLFPLMIGIGMSIDYSSAARMRTRLDAVADSASIEAVSAPMMAQSDAVAIAAATNLFNSQAEGLSGLVYSPSNLTVAAVDSGLSRTVTVSYAAKTVNQFGGLLGLPTISIGGTSSSEASAPPNVDFYVLLDSSPSMAIAATTSGINSMVSATQSQGGCAFACHQTSPASDKLGNPGGEDNYALARNLGVTLRLDNVRSAVQSLTTTAGNAEQTNGATYRIGIYTFDYSFNTLTGVTSDLASANDAAQNLQLLEVYDNNCLTQSNCNSDMDTNFDTGFSMINSTMPNPGAGSSNSGDTAQEVLFIVTDGVEDESSSGKRVISMINTNWCTTIRDRGIRIAVIYTTYYPLPTNSFYVSHVKPFQPNISTTMQACASPGLFYEVNTDGDITAALADLFEAVIATAHLTN